ATYTTSSLDAYDGAQNPTSPATHYITVEYGGDGSFAGSTSEAQSQSVGKAATMTTLVSGLNPSIYGNSVVFTATVTIQAPGAASMTGEDVTFRDGAATLGTGTLDASGIATVTTSLLSGGVHSVTAEYGGRTNITGSVSSGVMQTVNKASQSITFGALGDKVYGAAAFPVTATASSGLTVTFASMTPAVCTVSGNIVSPVANGACTI
ncbi:MAG: Ig-like domain repeat protein, partial [Caldilinea sp.]|nr:Ig-like domain repeat protein [Caldilinea sp.]